MLKWVAFPFSRGSSQPRIEPRSPTLQADSLLAELQGKPRNTGVGSLSLLQQIFLTQESNQGLLHCRQILYQLSYQSSRAWGLTLTLTLDSNGLLNCFQSDTAWNSLELTRQGWETR